MKAHLLFSDRDLDWSAPPAWNAEALSADLALETVFAAMAQGDERILEVVGKVVLAGVGSDLATISYRQGLLQDCLDHPAVVRDLYGVAVEMMEAARRHYFGSLIHYPDWVLSKSVDLMDMLVGFMKRLRSIADQHGRAFRSEGWRQFFEMIQRELGDAFFASAEEELRELQFYGGLWLSAELGRANKGARYRLLPRFVSFSCRGGSASGPGSCRRSRRLTASTSIRATKPA